MKRFIAAALTTLAIGGTLVAAQPASGNLEPRVARLEATVADLQARVAILEASPAPSASAALPSPSATPAASSTATAGPSASPWTLAFSDDFATWDPSQYFIYGDPADGAGGYRDTQEQQIAGTGGFYSPTAYSVVDGTLRIRLYTDSTGVPRVAAFIPQLIPGTSRGLSSMAYEFVIRADRMVGYKGVPLLWPDSGVWPRDGEINWPESNFDARPSGFVHYQSATSGSDQAFFAAPTGTSWQDRHKYRLEWISGTSVKAYLDDALIATVTNRIPNTPMHLVNQFETDLADTRPDPAISGFVEMDYLKVWSYAP